MPDPDTYLPTIPTCAEVFWVVRNQQVIASGYDFIFDELADGATADYTVFVDVPAGFDVDSAEYYIVVVGERP